MSTKNMKGSARRRSRSPIGRKSDGDRHMGGGRESKASRRVYVANVPFDVKWSELKDLFREHVGNVVFCNLFENEEGKSRGCGLVEFQDSASARKAIEALHRFSFKGRELVVKEDLDCERDRFGRLILPNSRRDKERGDRDSFSSHGDAFDNGHFSSGGQYNTYGLSTQFLDSLGVSGPLNNRIFVANLDYKVGEHKLEEIFKLAGKVTRVKLATDSAGNSRGHGTVEFEHPVEAVQAISMFHNQKLFARPLSVRMDKYEADESDEPAPGQLPSGLETIGKGLGIGGQPLNISKSMLNSALSTPAPVQQQQPLANTATAALSALTNLAGNLQQLPSAFAQSALSQLGSTAAPVSAASALGSSGLGLNSGFDRNISGLTGANGNALSGMGGGAGGLATSFANTAQNMLATLTAANPSALSASGLNALGGLNNSSLMSQQPNGSLAGLYSNYEREFRDDKYGRGGGGGQQPQSYSDTIVIRNLPATFSYQNLRDRFNEIGEIRYAELKGPGQAIVRFRNERDAQRCVELMNGIRIENHPIEVNFYY